MAGRWVLGIVCVVEAGWNCPSVVAAPPLSLDGLLGDDQQLSEQVEKPRGLKADNFMCLVCHGDLDAEQLVVRHAREGVGCVECHGPSVAHADDEEHVIPPDKMFDHADVDKMCAQCHRRHEVPAREVVARCRARGLAGKTPGEIACTDCHFQHYMTRRTVQWNRRTKEFIIEANRETNR